MSTFFVDTVCDGCQIEEMTNLLRILAAIYFCGGVINVAMAKSAIHEILGGVGMLIAAICFVGSCFLPYLRRFVEEKEEPSGWMAGLAIAGLLVLALLVGLLNRTEEEPDQRPLLHDRRF